MKKRFFLLMVVALALALAAPAAAQDDSNPEYRIDLNRDFGYGAGANVRGNFSASIYGALDNVASVVYYIDEEELGRASESPFRVKFVTSTYADGWHELWAQVTTIDGRVIDTERARLNFISREQEGQSMGRIFGILLPVILIVTVIGVLVQSSMLRGQKVLPPGTPRNYGAMGGAICPRCNRPFAVHLWSVSLLVGRLDRCDNCGKWSLVRRAPPQILAAAEQAERAAYRNGESNIPAATVETEEEKLRRQIDESKYTGE